MTTSLAAATVALAAAVMCSNALAQYGQCRPVGQRTDELGCWIIAVKPIGELPRQPMYWHLSTYPTRAEAEKAAAPRATVVESLGKIWLLTIEPAGWRPSGGQHVAEIGPLPLENPAAKFTTVYYEAVFTP